MLQESHQGFTLWFTGLSGAGKSTLAKRLEEELTARGYRVEVVDGDEFRTRLSKGLGFSKEDRLENLSRISYVCKLLSKHGVIAIAAAISPYREAREKARAENPHFIEIYVKCSLEELIRRDVKGLYAKALKGEIKQFTGISDPYEEPENPEIVVESDKETPEESVRKILTYLEEKGYLEPLGDGKRPGWRKSPL